MKGLSPQAKWRSAVQILIGGHVVAAGLATYFGHDTWYSKCLMPCVQLLGPETAHWLAIKAAKYKAVPYIKQDDPSCLKTKVWGRHFKNPIGLAAGFDKHAEAVDGMLSLGFGFVEVGSVTPNPQPGNPTPRLFRLTEDQAVINRYGFNSEGHKAVLERLKGRQERLLAGVVGINLGKNKDSVDAAADYVAGVHDLGPAADYLVINISCPNTPGVTNLQGRQQLQSLVDKVLDERSKLPAEHQPPLLVKISPDLTEQDKVNIAAVVARPKGGVDGLIISNTTITRPSHLKSKHKVEVGGLSGLPIRDLSTQLIRDMYKLTQGRLPIIGVGGVSSGQDAYDKLCAGASLIQVYTVMTYEGPPVIRKIKTELSEIMQSKGFSSVSEIVGLDFRDAKDSLRDGAR